MPCLVCGQQHNGAPVRLITGESVCNYSEAWRIECEARTVLSWPLTRRREYLDRLIYKRGADYVEQLKIIIKTIWSENNESRRHGNNS